MIPSYEIYTNSNAALCKVGAIEFIHVRVREGRVLTVLNILVPVSIYILHTRARRVSLAAPRVVMN